MNNCDGHIVIMCDSVEKLKKIYGVEKVYSESGGNLVGVSYRGKVLWYKKREDIGIYVSCGTTTAVMENTLKVAV